MTVGPASARLTATLVAEWHPTRNAPLRPVDVTSGSSRPILWRCRTCETVWTATVYSRARLGTGCPVCVGKAVKAGFNDLQTLRPDLAAQWHPTRNDLRPDQVRPHTSRAVWWLCDSCGETWKTSVANRSNGTGCPRRRFSIAEWELRAELLALGMPAAAGPYRVFGRKAVDVAAPAWRIAVEFDGGHWHSGADSMVRDREMTGRICEQGWYVVRVRDGLPDLGVDLPAMARCVMVPAKASTIAVGQAVVQRILVDVGLIENRLDALVRGEFRAWCTSQRVGDYLTRTTRVSSAAVPMVCDFNDPLTLTHPDLAAEWDAARNFVEHGRRVDQVRAGWGRRVHWLCSTCGHRFANTVDNRSRGSGCPACAGKTVEAGVNDLATTHPKIASQWYRCDTATAGKVTAGSHLMVQWQCESGHRWSAAIYSRTSGSGCPICSNRTCIPGVNDLVTTHPDLAVQWDFGANTLGPAEVTAGSNKRVAWCCGVCQHRWNAVVKDRVRGRGCPQCAVDHRATARRTPGPGKSLADLLPAIAAQWHPTRNLPLTPAMVCPTTLRQAWWQCSSGHEWSAPTSKRDRGGIPSPCRACVEELRQRRQREAVDLRAQGCTVRAIATHLGITHPTVIRLLQTDPPQSDRK